VRHGRILRTRSATLKHDPRAAPSGDALAPACYRGRMAEPSGSESARRAWTRAEIAALATFLGLAAASLAWLVHPWYEPANDASLYILTSRALLHGEGYSYLGHPFIVRPPGFSVLLMPVLGLFGTDFRALNAFVSLCGIGALTLLFALVRERLGALVSFALCASLWLNPSFQHLCNMVLSDVPGLAALLGCLMLERWAARTPSARRDFVLGLAIGLAALVRTVNVLVLPAVWLARAWARRALPAGARRSLRTELGLVGAGCLVVLAPWTVRDQLVAPAAPVDQNYLYSQWTSLLHVDATDPGSARRPLSEFVERLPARGEQLLSLLGTRMLENDAGTTALLLGALFLLAALLRTLRRPGSEELFLGLALLPLLFFQAFLDRHVLPVYVLALAALAHATLLGLERLGARERLARGFVALILALFALVDLRPRQGWELIERRHREVERFCAVVRPRLRPEDRVASYLGWHYSVYLERPVWSLLFGLRTAGPEGMRAALTKYELDTVIGCDYFPGDQRLLPLLEPWAVSREELENATILRLR
jgi:hypothetical protein